MKVELEKTAEFKPIELKITIERIGELITLLAYFNMPNSKLHKEIPSFVKDGEIDTEIRFDIFEKLEKAYKSL